MNPFRKINSAAIGAAQRGVSLARRCGYPVGPNDFALEKLKNRHKGRRIFVLGNGPSLNVDSLDRLIPEISFGMNQVYRVFPYTKWRPSYILISDTLVAENYGSELLEKYKGIILASYHLKAILGSNQRIIYFRKTHEDFSYDDLLFSTNPHEHLVGGYTSAYLCLQLAWFFGCRRFITMGIDASYSVESAMKEEPIGDFQVVRGMPSSNYSIPGYADPGKKALVPSVQHQLIAYKSALAFISKNGGSIVNAGQESPLTLFPKASLDELLEDLQAPDKEIFQ